MEINFKNIKEKMEHEIKIGDILLSENNPRFTLMTGFDNNLMEFLVTNSVRNRQKIIFKKLLVLEGNFKDLLRLLDNILINNFNNETEQIYLVKNKNENNYIVAEGNRRLMCLKLIFGDLHLFNLDDVKDIISSYANENSEYINSQNDENNGEVDIEIHKTYENCELIIEDIKKKYEKFIVYYEIITDSNNLWKIIYDKHLTGERPGMRKWSRAKYYADLLNVFPDGISNEDTKTYKIFNNINREKLIVIKDFKEAQFVYSCIFFGEKYNIGNPLEEVVDFKVPQILQKMIELGRVSALEMTHSFNKIRRMLCDNVLKIDISDFKKEFIDVIYSKENYRINFNCNMKIKLSSYLLFIYSKWLEKIITTRPIKSADRELLISDLRFLLNDIDIKNKLSFAQINELDEFDLSIVQLEDVVLSNKYYYTENVLARFVLAKKIKITNAKFKKILENRFRNKEEPINVFWILKNQLDFNAKAGYLNALGATLRSIIEQLLIWMAWSEPNKEKRYNIKEIAEDPTNWLFKKVTKNIDDVIVIRWLEHYYSNKDNVSKKEIEFLKGFKFNKNDDLPSDKNEGLPSDYTLLNNFIHASHRVYIEKIYIDNLKRLNEIQKIVIDVLTFIDESKFGELNIEIIKYIKENK